MMAIDEIGKRTPIILLFFFFVSCGIFGNDPVKPSIVTIYNTNNIVVTNLITVVKKIQKSVVKNEIGDVENKENLAYIESKPDFRLEESLHNRYYRDEITEREQKAWGWFSDKPVVIQEEESEADEKQSERKTIIPTLEQKIVKKQSEIKPKIEVVETNVEQFDLTPMLALKGHTEYLFFADFSPDSKYLATGSGDKTIRIWDYIKGKEVYKIQEAYDKVWGMPLKYTPNGRYMVVGAYENVKVFDVKSNYTEVAKKYGHKRGIQGVAVSPDSKYAVTVGVDGFLMLWTVPGLIETAKVKAHSSESWSVDYAPSGKVVVTGGEDGTAKIWRTPDLTNLVTINFHHSPIEFVQFSVDGKYLLLASEDGTISVWDTKDYSKPYQRLRGHLGSVVVACFTRDGKYILSGGVDDEMYLYSVETGDTLKSIKKTLVGCYVCDGESGRQVCSFCIERHDGFYI